MPNSAKRIARVLIVLSVLAVVAEFATRLSGTANIPTYHVDDGIGYIPNASQFGAFLRTHRWVFNERSMGTGQPWTPSRERNVLLIGNSIVMGGNPYDQPQKLGPLIQQLIGGAYTLWPVAAGGWTNVNEMVYLERNPDVASSLRFFIWEYMSGGLSGLAKWQGDYVWPRERPVCESCYVFRRYVLPRLISRNSSELPPVGKVNFAELQRFEVAVSELSKGTGESIPGIILLYPTAGEYATSKRGIDWLPERAEIERIARINRLTVVDLAAQPAWKESLYRSDRTHPTVEGNRLLAKIIAAAIASSLSSSRHAGDVSAETSASAQEAGAISATRLKLQ